MSKFLLDAAATSFGEDAAGYDAAREECPIEALASALEGIAHGEWVLELSARTGIVTRQLAAIQNVRPDIPKFHLLAAEHDERMLEVFRERRTDAQILPFSTNAIPLDDASVDVVVIANGYPWLNRPAIDAEVARVLRDGGRYAVLSTTHDPQDRATSALANFFANGLGDPTQITIYRNAWGAPFGAATEAPFRFTARYDLKGILALSHTYFPYRLLSSDAERGRHDERLQRILGAMRADADGRYALPFVTHLRKATRGLRVNDPPRWQHGGARRR